MKQIGLLLWTNTAGLKSGKKWIWFLGMMLVVLLAGIVSHGIKEAYTPEVTSKLTLGVANEDSSEYASLLINYFKENEAFSAHVEVIEEAENKLQQRIEESRLDAYLSIPPMFSESLMYMKHLPVKAVISLENPTKALLFQRVFEAYETYIKAVEVNCYALYEKMEDEGFSAADVNAANIDISLDLIFTALGKGEFFRVREVERIEESSLVEEYMAAGVCFALFFFLLPLGMKVQKLKQNGLIHRLKTMNVSMVAVYFSCLLPWFLPVAVLTLVLFLQGGKSMVAACFGCLPLLLVAVLLLLFGVVLQKKKDYLFLSSLLFVVMAVLGGSTVPVRFLPDLFAKLAVGMPNYRFVQALVLSETGIQRQEYALFTGVLVLFLMAVGILCLKRGESETHEA